MLSIRCLAESLELVEKCTTEKPSFQWSSSTISSLNIIPEHTEEPTSLKLEPRKSPISNQSGSSDFVSFDDWKQEKLRQKKQEYQDRPQRRSSSSIHNSQSNGDLIRDTLEVDFEIFNEDEPEGKIYKERFNYASLDCAATIMKTNSEAIGAASVLFENKDKSLLNPCSAPNKFVVIELCEDVLVDSIVMANHEFFSSTFRKLRFSVSERFPVPKNGWKVLGEFEAENSRNAQTFKFENPMIWARYLRIEILSYYGEEFYCPITLVRAHGIAMIDEFKMEVQNPMDDYGQGDIEIEEDLLTEREKCVIPQTFSTNNMSIHLQDNLNHQCIASLKHMNFDEFFKGHKENENITRIKETGSYLPMINTEESIFKNIMKRLAGLETNTTMSILYIEEQSRLLTKSFGKLEDSYAEKFENLISVFNETMNNNLDKLNIFAQQLRESSLTVIEEQRFSIDKFMTEAIKKIETLEKDSRYQTRMSYLMLFGFITLLLYILLTRESYMEEHLADDGWYSDRPPFQKLKESLKRSVSGINENFAFEAKPSYYFSSDSEFDDDNDSVIISNK